MSNLQELILPVLPLRDVVIYPGMVVSLFVGRTRSIAATKVAIDNDSPVFLVAQQEANKDSPNFSDIYKVGTIAKILQNIELSNGNLKLLVEGLDRAEIIEYYDSADVDFESATIKVFPNEEPVIDNDLENLLGVMWNRFIAFAKTQERLTTEIIDSLAKLNDPIRKLDSIATHLNLSIDKRQKLLEINDFKKRATELLKFIEIELDLMQMEQKIHNQVKKQMDKNHREYYLNEQLKAIHKELNNNSLTEIERIKEKITKTKLTKEALDKANTELAKLKTMPVMSSEATVIRNYLDYLLDVPWQQKTAIKINLDNAQKILDKEHYGLEEVKERVIEFLAVQKRTKTIKGPVLCLVGPPGVGKTSLAESIARATGRKYVRMALGGVRDEAEIRGHRRTYIGAMPGRIIQKMSKVKVNNPLFLLDEIDKMGQDFRGDPASALLEVLDPEQNHTFNDHYLEVDYDLSKVLFLCTANSMNIPQALLDRMEVIRLSGYTEDEKLNIAEQYLVPKQITANGLKKSEISFTKDALLEIIQHYTSEAGVRSLERQIAKICRKVVKKIANLATKTKKELITKENITNYLGVIKFRHDIAFTKDQIGQVQGLAWTQVGGELLTIEASVIAGNGKLIKTGSVGDVMSESMTAAMTVVRSRTQTLGLADDFYKNIDVHIHIPEGATPKDGPSAGIGLCTALVSALTKIPVRADVAMTGEITLQGKVLAIGGLKEKLLAAHRGGIKNVLIPQENVHNLKEIAENIKQNLNIIPVSWIDEVLEHALQNMTFMNNKSHKILTKINKIGDNLIIRAH